MTRTAKTRKPITAPTLIAKPQAVFALGLAESWAKTLPEWEDALDRGITRVELDAIAREIDRTADLLPKEAVETVFTDLARNTDAPTGRYADVVMTCTQLVRTADSKGYPLPDLFDVLMPACEGNPVAARFGETMIRKMGMTPSLIAAW